MGFASSIPLSPTSNVPDQVWVIIAAYNEESRIGATLSSLLPHYRSIVVVDDGSTDGTGAVIRGHDVWVLRHVINCGQGAALQTGIDFAIAQGAGIVVTFDADGQHDSEEIEALIRPIRSGKCDVALGSRFLGKAVGMPWSRRVVLKLGVLFTRLFSGIRVTDTHNGLRALSRRAAQTIHITQERMAHASEVLDLIRQHRLSYEEVPVTIRYSGATIAKGQSSWNALKIVGKLLLGRLVR